MVNSNPRNKFRWNLKRNSYIFIQENAFENFCDIAVISSRPHCVKTIREISGADEGAEVCGKCSNGISSYTWQFDNLTLILNMKTSSARHSVIVRPVLDEDQELAFLGSWWSILVYAFSASISKKTESRYYVNVSVTGTTAVVIMWRLSYWRPILPRANTKASIMVPFQYKDYLLQALGFNHEDNDGTFYIQR